MLVVQPKALQAVSIVIREAQDSDIKHVVALFCETGVNPYDWNAEKWMHYYRYYPDGKAVSLIAINDGEIVGHYGLQPIKIGDITAMLGLHAYVATSQRGLNIISALMREADRMCELNGSKMICGFANPQFTSVKSIIFKWHTLCWLGFQAGVSELDYSLMRSKKFYFNHSVDWLSWRFGSLKDRFVSLYIDQDENEHIQLLKWRRDKPQIESEKFEVWSPRSTYRKSNPGQFCQPFSIKIYDPKLIQVGILDYKNWAIDMGDSDTFRYSPVRIDL